MRVFPGVTVKKHGNVYYVGVREDHMDGWINPRDLIKARVIGGTATCPCLSGGECVYSVGELDYLIRTGRIVSITKNILSLSIPYLSAFLTYFTVAKLQERKIKGLVKKYLAEHMSIETEWDTDECLQQEITIFRHS